jgi:type I restriction enzyme, S subunit
MKGEISHRGDDNAMLYVLMDSHFPQISISQLISNGEAELKTGPFGTQLKAGEYTEMGTPVINVRNIGMGAIKVDKLEYISNETRDRLSSHILRCNDIVFGRKGAVERHVFIRPEQDGWFQGSDCLRLRLNSSKIEPLFASYFFLTDEHKTWIMNQCSHGATMASLNQGILERIQLPVPPLPLQKRIAGILSAYDELIENNQKRIGVLEKMARGLYREWFVKFRFPGHESAPRVASSLGEIPEGWEVRKLGEVAEDLRRNVPKGDLEDSTPYVGLEHIPRRSLALDAWEMASSLGSNKLSFKKGEVLFGKIRPYFHKVSVAPFDGLCSADTIVIRARSSNHYALVVACVSSDAFVAEASATANGAKMPRANWNVLEQYPIIIPSGAILKTFSNLFSGIVEQQQKLIFQIENLRQTRDLLLPRLLSGELAVQTDGDGGGRGE